MRGGKREQEREEGRCMKGEVTNSIHRSDG